MLDFDVVQQHHLQHLSDRVAVYGSGQNLRQQLRAETGQLRLLHCVAAWADAIDVPIVAAIPRPAISATILRCSVMLNGDTSVRLKRK